MVCQGWGRRTQLQSEWVSRIYYKTEIQEGSEVCMWFNDKNTGNRKTAREHHWDSLDINWQNSSRRSGKARQMEKAKQGTIEQSSDTCWLQTLKRAKYQAGWTSNRSRSGQELYNNTETRQDSTGKNKSNAGRGLQVGQTKPCANTRQ